MELMQASNQWANRPHDERFLSMLDMRDHFQDQKARSRELVIPSNAMQCVPVGDNHKGLAMRSPQGHEYVPTHWTFGQLATLANSPAGYLRKLPSEMAADCLNYGLQVMRDQDEMGVLLYRNGSLEMRAATGPRYGRIWNLDVVNAVIN